MKNGIFITMSIILMSMVIDAILYNTKTINDIKSEFVTIKNTNVSKGVQEKSVDNLLVFEDGFHDDKMKEEISGSENDVDVEDGKERVVEEGVNGFVVYKNEFLGISFIYPEEWGKVEMGIFDNTGKSVYYSFSDVVDSQMGGLYEDYFENPPIRGGTLIDFQGFDEKNLEDVYKKEGYEMSKSGNCVYTTEKKWFENTVFHAVCNLNNKIVPGYNFAFGGRSNSVNIDEDDFVRMVESVIIQ
ncbi:MAG: hypothetical protein CR972_00365 [Candidatus Moraniibacteriota bacterium]|nr:MAG: hypothetical protein CR972_00365 [Candidatus Moranbacteria bacterium]